MNVRFSFEVFQMYIDDGIFNPELNNIGMCLPKKSLKKI
jgi:hypothetical protein